jgi:hypothetical protein
MNLLLVFLAVIVLIASEFTAYFWHRFLAHDILYKNPVKQMHDIHHNVIDDQAHGDFLYVLLLLFLLFVTLFYFYIQNYIDIYIFCIIFITSLLSFTYSWIIHSAYHINNHWLNQYQWFRIDKKIHMQHHENSNVNYGITSHFPDIIFDTYQYYKINYLKF